MSKRDVYDILGVSKSATDKELKSAFRKLAMQHHPDRNPGDEAAEQAFKEVNEAYDALKDPQKRAAYDQFGHAAFEQGGGGNPFGGGAGAAGFDGFGDIFEEMFGSAFGGRRGGGRSQPGRGSDLQYNMSITLDEAYEGKTAQIKVPSAESCTTCSGSGAKPGTSPTTCGTCGGRGRVRTQNGIFAMERGCPSCNGHGQVISDPCRSCNGAGKVAKDKQLSVNIPAGVEDGTRIRLSGEGELGQRGGPSGDLYIFLNIKDHDLFERDAQHLFVSMPVSMSTAALGGEIEVPSIDGTRVRVKISSGAQSGQQLRLRGKGMSIYRRQDRGDLYVRVEVETPTNLTKRQKELLEEFEKEGNAHSPLAAKFLSKVKGFFNAE